MFLLNWYKEYLEIKAERDARKRDLSFCSACETLKLQLAIANDERKMLISKLTDKPVVEDRRAEPENYKQVLPNRMNWNLRRQMLEAEDRAAAKVLRTNEKANIGSKPLTVTEIEKELGVSEDAAV